MGIKSRSNYALGLSLSDEDFNRIFNKEKLDEQSESESKEKGKQTADILSVEQSASLGPAEETERR